MHNVINIPATVDNNNNNNNNNNKAAHHRARWAALGAAVAVSLGAGGLSIASATAPEGASAYVPVTPCRLVDTRPGAGQVGAQVGAVPADTAITVTGRGAVPGTCSGVVPDTATGLQLNVTAVNATQATFLTLYPQGAQRPVASNVNVDSPAATPNAAAVTLNAANGQFDIYNRFGSTDVVIDIAGFYTDHQHDGDDIINSSLTRVDIADEPGLASNSAPNPNPIGILDTLVSVDLHAPASGHVTVSASAVLDFPNDATTDQVSCLIGDGTNNVAATLEQIVTEPAPGADQSIQITRSFPVAAAGEQTYSMVCGTPFGDAIASQAFITATYVPTWRGDIQIAPFPVGPIGPIIVDPGL